VEIQAKGSDLIGSPYDHLKEPAEKIEERQFVAAKRLKSTFLGIVQKERPIGEKPWRATSALMRGLGILLFSFGRLLILHFQNRDKIFLVHHHIPIVHFGFLK